MLAEGSAKRSAVGCERSLVVAGGLVGVADGVPAEHVGQVAGAVEEGDHLRGDRAICAGRADDVAFGAPD